MHPLLLLVQVWERMKVVIEPAAACTVAAVLSDKFKAKAGPDVKRVGIVLCGGNLDLDNIPWIKNWLLFCWYYVSSYLYSTDMQSTDMQVDCVPLV